MPVSIFPLATWLLLLAFVALSAFRGKKPLLKSVVWSIVCVVSILLTAYIPGGVLWLGACKGDAEFQFKYARWKENHVEWINNILFWPGRPDVEGGYYWLSKSAEQDFPPALFAQGVRLKYGQHVPKPATWSGPAGNVFPQPRQGQFLIDRSHSLGYIEPVPEEAYYWQYFRR